MTPSIESFLPLLHILPEPTLLLTSQGHVLAVNPRFEQRFELAATEIVGTQLAAKLATSAETVAEFLKQCAISKQLVLGALEVACGPTDNVPCRAEGAALSLASNEHPAILMLRLIPKSSVTGKFASLKQRVELLASELGRAHTELATLLHGQELPVELRSIDDAVIITDLDGQVRSLNALAEALTGWPASEAIGQPLSQVFHALDEHTRLPIPNPIQGCLSAGTAIVPGNHTLLLTRGGFQRPIDEGAAPIRDQQGTTLGVVLIFRDVTEYRFAEHAVRESEERLRLALDASGMGDWDWNISTGEVKWSDNMQSVFGAIAEPAPPTLDEILSLVHPDDRLSVQHKFRTAVEDCKQLDLEFRIFTADKSFRWVTLSGKVICDHHDKPLRIVGVVTDVTERKMSEQGSRFLADVSAALAALDMDFESTLQHVVSLAVPFFADWCVIELVDVDGVLRRLAIGHADPEQVTLANRIERLYPTRSEDFLGPHSVLRTGKTQFLREVTDEVLRQFAYNDDHLELLRRLELKSALLLPLVARGVTVGVVSVAMAESQRRFTVADLSIAEEVVHRISIAVENARLYRELQDADRRKDEFLAMLAHELRNPLAPLSNALHLLAMPAIEPSIASEAHASMQRQVQHLTRLVDDLLDVSRIMRGKIDLRPEEVDVAAIVARAAETAQSVIETNGHRLHVTLPEEPLLLQADATRLAQVVANLLNNAAKYTERGGQIWLTVKHVQDEAVIAVRDTGIGITADVLPHVFDLFVQAAQSLNRAQGGLGIGLTLVRRLVELHGGSVSAESAGQGQGSLFVVRLPCTQPRLGPRRTPVETSRTQRSTPPRRILIVDDNVDSATTLALLLKIQQHEVYMAHDGPTAISIARESTPEIVLLDIGMPGMDGYEAAGHLRRLPGGNRILLVALTGWGQEQYRRRTQEAGFDHHFVKPVQLAQLEGLLHDFEKRPPPQS